MGQAGHATLVADPYRGFSVVITDPWGNVVYRTSGQESIEAALTDAARWLGKPVTIELKQIA